MKNEDGYMYVDLPEPRYNLPREKPLPTPKPLTKWQKFAIEKGIKKTPKPKATWDDILQVFFTNIPVYYCTCVYTCFDFNFKVYCFYYFFKFYDSIGNYTYSKKLSGQFLLCLELSWQLLYYISVNLLDLF